MTSLPLGLGLMLVISCIVSVHYARAADRLTRRVASRDRVIRAKREEIGRLHDRLTGMADELAELEMILGLAEQDARTRHPSFTVLDGGA